MAVSRDSRNTNRRRRVIRSSEPESDRRKSSRRRSEDAPAEERRRVGYSQNVRKACGQRLVGLIPVGLSSYLFVVSISLAIPALLLLGHYMIYVSGSLPWYGHPLAVSLDASHANSLAAWFSSHLWLLCLATTVLTFQIRQHKLDDYQGEYRLWFWLVFTCLLASIDAATHISELLGLALTPWSQRTLGWTGPAVVKATMATMIGLLGLRLCTELKSVPLSLVFWLTGLFAWAGSAALAQDELRLEMSLQFRIWLKATLWLGGLTAVWLSALTYLRHVYIAAQQRFLARRRSSGTSFGQRMKEKLPRLRRDDDAEDGEPRGWRLPGFGRRRAEEEEEAEKPKRTTRSRRKTRASEDVEEDEQEESTRTTRTARRRKTAARASDDEDAVDEELQAPRQRRGLGGFFRKERAERTESDATEDEETEEGESRRGGIFGWFGGGSAADDDAEEYRKVSQEERQRQREEKQAARELAREEKARLKAERRAEREAERQAAQEDGESRGWFSWGRKSDDESDDSREEAEASEGKSKGWFRRRADSSEGSENEDAPKKKRGLFSRFSLQPPDDGENEDADEASNMRSVDRSRSMPSTEPDDEDEPADKPLTRAERKRLRKQKRRAA